MDLVEQVWRKDYSNVTGAIPAEWVITDDDGYMWIRHEYADQPQVALMKKLALVGYAHGWL